jgi:putative endonuclease
MPSSTQRRGFAAERRAMDHLVSHGLRPVDRNAGSKVGELDLVMLDGDTLVFVEVRSRASRAFGGAAASIDAAKRTRVRRAAQHWLQRRFGERSWPACRFDVVAIDDDVLDWIRDAF